MQDCTEKGDRAQGDHKGRPYRTYQTPEVHEKQGVAYVLEFATFEGGDGWGWKMRPELRQVLETGKYKWAADWIK